MRVIVVQREIFRNFTFLEVFTEVRGCEEYKLPL
jgi:hypothetical protein